jgi:hypothetical protein
VSDFVYLPAADWDYRLDVDAALKMIQSTTAGDLYRCAHEHKITLPNMGKATCRHQEGCTPMLVASVRASVPLPLTTQTRGNDCA